MKKLFTLTLFFLILSGASFLQSCKSKPSAQTSSSTINNTQVLQVDKVLSDAGQLAGQNIEVEGICTHICAHGGGKIFLMGSDDTKNIRIEAGKEIGKFKPETVNNVVRVKGILVEDRIDEAYLTQWEEKVKAQTDEKHGNSEAGCSSEQKARGEAVTNSTQERIDNFRKRIAERKEKEGKDYLSFYHIDAQSYTIQ